MRQAVKVIQVFRVEREIIFHPNAQSVEKAVESVQNGDIDVPSFDHPEWKEDWKLQNEEVEPA